MCNGVEGYVTLTLTIQLSINNKLRNKYKKSEPGIYENNHTYINK